MPSGWMPDARHDVRMRAAFGDSREVPDVTATRSGHWHWHWHWHRQSR